MIPNESNYINATGFSANVTDSPTVILDEASYMGSCHIMAETHRYLLLTRWCRLEQQVKLAKPPCLQYYAVASPRSSPQTSCAGYP